MSEKILVAGAINTDLIAYVDRAPDAGETITGRSFEMHGGGKAANQAVACARSGAEAVMLGGVGHDAFGDGRRADLESEGIDVSWIQTPDDTSSGVALITVEPSGENRIAYIPAATLAVSPQHARNAVESVIPGLILSANELSLSCHQELFGWAKAHDVPVVYNVAPYSDEAKVLLPLVDVLIVNRGEARALLDESNRDASAEELGARLRDLGVDRVVITLGEDGVIGVSGEGVVRIAGMDVVAVDTIGAGDTFCGAFAARLLEGASFADAIAFGNAAGAISVTRRGAQPSIPTRHEVEGAITEGVTYK
jgi:ribokinase